MLNEDIDDNVFFFIWTSNVVFFFQSFNVKGMLYTVFLSKYFGGVNPFALICDLYCFC